MNSPKWTFSWPEMFILWTLLRWGQPWYNPLLLTGLKTPVDYLTPLENAQRGVQIRGSWIILQNAHGMRFPKWPKSNVRLGCRSKFVFVWVFCCCCCCCFVSVCVCFFVFVFLNLSIFSSIFIYGIDCDDLMSRRNGQCTNHPSFRSRYATQPISLRIPQLRRGMREAFRHGHLKMSETAQQGKS